MKDILIGEAFASSIDDAVLLHAVAYETFYDVLVGGYGPKKQVVTSPDGIGLFLDYGNHTVPIPLVLFDKVLYGSEVDKLQERYVALRTAIWSDMSVIVKAYAALEDANVDEKAVKAARDRLAKHLDSTLIWQQLSMRTILLSFLFSDDKNDN